jgi:hypothetical protein
LHFDLFFCLAALFVACTALIARKFYDFLQRKRFERMVDRVGEAR